MHTDAGEVGTDSERSNDDLDGLDEPSITFFMTSSSDVSNLQLPPTPPPVAVVVVVVVSSLVAVATTTSSLMCCAGVMGGCFLLLKEVCHV